MDELFKEGLKKAIENGLFIVVLSWFGYEMMQKQDEMLKANEAKNKHIQQTAVETINKVANQRDKYFQELIDCMNDRIIEQKHDSYK